MSARSKAWRLLELALVAFGPAFMAAWLVGWIVKDANRWSVWLFFIPTLAPIIVGAIWCTAAQHLAPRLLQVFVQSVLVIASAKLLLVDCRWRGTGEPPPAAIKVVQWNTARRFTAAEDVFRTVRKDKPDICLFSESPRIEKVREMGNTHLGLPYSLDDAGMTLFSRFPMQKLGTIPITGGRAWAVRIFSPLGPLDVVAFDLISHPLLDRFTPMREMSEWIRTRPRTLPLLILGDFNTPRDSLSFEPLRRHVKNAHEVAGGGWPYTWPVPLPMYSIDNAWVSHDIRVFGHRHRPSRLSDHLRQVFLIIFQQPADYTGQNGTGAMHIPPLESRP